MNNEIMINGMDGDACVISNQGKVVLEPAVDVDTLYYPSHGLCQVEKNGMYGYIDESGELVIPFKYEKAYPFSENGLAFVVCENGYGGYINQDDVFVIAPIYETGSIFRFGMAAVSRNGEYKYIYKNGTPAIGSTFKYAGAFSECGLAKVVEFNGLHSFMDTRSRVILQVKEGFELEEFKDGSRVAKFTDGKREVLINAAGKIITRSYDKIIVSATSRYNPFLLNGLWGYLHDNGEEIIPNIYLEASEFTEDKVALVKAAHPLAENGEWEFYINEDDEILDDEAVTRSQQRFTEEFAHVNPFKKSMALAVKKEKSEKPEEIYEELIVEKDERDDYSVMEVEIFFHSMEKDEINALIDDKFVGIFHVVKTEDDYAKLLYFLDSSYEPVEIESILYFALDEGSLGVCDYVQLN